MNEPLIRLDIIPEHARYGVERALASYAEKLPPRRGAELTSAELRAMADAICVAADLLRERALDAPTEAIAPCLHGVTFDAEAARGLSAEEVRRRWPRLNGACPLGCGYRGIAYASFAQHIAGDW